jgi:DNA-directed RNA polymerase specialized sigma24 family protein
MRRCLALRVEQDLKYREIASVMRLSIDTVKAHLFQARQRLKETLGDELAAGGSP